MSASNNAKIYFLNYRKFRNHSVRRVYRIYKYFKGQNENPYDNEKHNPQHQFWGYGSTFEDKFNKGDFTPDLWVDQESEEKNEWIAILNKKPVNKEELFKLWLFKLLMVHLPDKAESEDWDGFLRLYWDRTSISL